ncbi:hypothetical protein STEG23_021473 [Scotinomys teguina]
MAAQQRGHHVERAAAAPYITRTSHGHHTERCPTSPPYLFYKRHNGQDFMLNQPIEGKASCNPNDVQHLSMCNGNKAYGVQRLLGDQEHALLGAMTTGSLGAKAMF